MSLSEYAGPDLLPYRIRVSTEWETLDVDARAVDDEHAKAKARRYCSLEHVGRNFPSLIIADVVRGDETEQPVGTWEYRVRCRRPGLLWHPGVWTDRPDTGDRQALRAIGIELRQSLEE